MYLTVPQTKYNHAQLQPNNTKHMYPLLSAALQTGAELLVSLGDEAGHLEGALAQEGVLRKVRERNLVVVVVHADRHL